MRVDRMLANIRMGDVMARRMLAGNPTIQTEISPSGRAAVRWVENRDKIIFLGMIMHKPEDDKLEEDLAYAKKWRAHFENALAAGKVLMASTNEFSGPMLSGVIKRLARRKPPVTVDTITLGENEMAGFGTWKNIVVGSPEKLRAQGMQL